MNYNDLTRHHFEIAANAGVLVGPRTRRGEAGSRAQGTWVQFDVQVDPRHGVDVLAAIRFQAFACPHIIAVSDWIAAHAVGLEATARLPESVSSLRQRFGLPIEKLGRLLIVEDAWKAAISPQNHEASVRG